MKHITRELVWFAWQWRLAWRVVMGRWFIFRDAPDFVVARCMQWEGEDHEDWIRDVGRQAGEEMLGRVRKIERDAERLLQGATP